MAETDSDAYYEEHYAAALERLRELGYQPGRPVCDPGVRQRICLVSGVSWTDETVFRKAFDSGTADHILNRRWSDAV